MYTWKKVEALPVVVPDAVFVLGIGAAVVDDDISDGLQAGFLQGVQKCLQLLLAAIVAVQLVKLSRQVALQARPLDSQAQGQSLA